MRRAATSPASLWTGSRWPPAGCGGIHDERDGKRLPCVTLDIVPQPDRSTGQMPGYKDELAFAVEEWNATTGGYVADIARSSNLTVGRGPHSARRQLSIQSCTSSFATAPSCWTSASQRMWGPLTGDDRRRGHDRSVAT
jgi:hypothetical protein